MEVCTHEKAVFFLPVNILTVWSPAFLAVRHTIVCLDIYIYIYICIYVCRYVDCLQVRYVCVLI